MPIFKTRNENFFKTWTPEMAYVLGFFTADGNMIRNKRGARFIEFQITDKDLLERIQELLDSNHKITTRKRDKKWKTSYRLQIGSKIIFNDLLNFGLTPKKSKKVYLPNIPIKYFSHFVRGYFDGDGNVVSGLFKKKGRKRKSLILLTRFTSGSKVFLENLQSKLKETISTKGSLHPNTGSWQLGYSVQDSRKLFKLMYGEKTKDLIYLKRKYKIYLKDKQIGSVA